MKLNINKFKKDLKIKFKKNLLLVKALTHKSSDQKNNNEKLEFLGDRVLGLVLAKKLYDLYPKESEGILDKKFANLVNRKVCCEIGLSINLQNYINIGDKKKKIDKNDKKIISDASEALIGAIYEDQGYDYVSSFVLRIWKKNINKSTITILDSKTKLQEYSLKHYKKLPKYKIVGSSGPKHNPTYKISVSITGSNSFVGIGNSKQSAELDGASKLLKDKRVI